MSNLTKPDQNADAQRHTVIMIMGMQRSGTTALFETLATAAGLVGFEESPGDAIYVDYYLRPEVEIRSLLRSIEAPILLKPVRETERRTAVEVIDEYKDYDLKILWLYRDPVNVIYSYQQMGWIEMAETESIAREWVTRNQVMLQLLRGYEKKVTFLRYEELLNEPRILDQLTKRVGLQVQSTLRPDSKAGRAKLPIAVQSHIDLLTYKTLRQLDRLNTSKGELGSARSPSRFLSGLVNRFHLGQAARANRLRPEDQNPSPDELSEPDFESAEFHLDAPAYFRRWRARGIRHYGSISTVWLFLEYNEVSDALMNSTRFIRNADLMYKSVLSSGDGGGSMGSAQVFSTAGTEVPSSRLEDRARQVLTPLLQLPSFDLVDTCRKLVSSLFYELLGVESTAENAFFEQVIVQKSGKELMSALTPSGLLSTILKNELHSQEDADRFLIFGSYYHYVVIALVSNMIHALLGKPELMAEIRREPASLVQIIPELTRLTYPLLLVQWWTKAEVTLGGKVIPAGHLVYLALGSANRDPKVFARPDEIIGSRDLTSHPPLTSYEDPQAYYWHWEQFGRTVIETLLRVLLTQFPPLQATQPLDSAQFVHTQGSGDFRDTLQTPFMRHLASLSVRFQM